MYMYLKITTRKVIGMYKVFLVVLCVLTKCMDVTHYMLYFI